ncbi:hypothetical protein [Nocardia wallacei]|uniref:Uncharacterized protein n=1 Tax=Nocardia wallacei TaxID=480035 RepID=A0A7G1KTE1_9NOCA|nr:hypothetical protein [Nocardia wallacei]BCK58372.1 hypothetical protein NWFMUON74_61440 [Nocardia wallacei]
MEDWIDGPPATDRDGEFPAGVLLDVTRSEGLPLDGLVLVGHINELGGVCDDCRSCIRSEHVKRHRFVWRAPAERRE